MPWRIIELTDRWIYTFIQIFISLEKSLYSYYTWAHDTPYAEDPEVYICHTMAIFCRDFGYPAQDVLQLNDFWNEVHVRYQHFATQDPNYNYPRI